MMNPPLRLLAAFQTVQGRQAEWMLSVPDRELWIAADLVETPTVTIHAPDLEAETHFDRRSARQLRTTKGRPLPSWARLMAAATIAISEQGLSQPGVICVIVGDEPPGPRYEHTMGMALGLLWYALNEQEITAAQLLTLMERAQQWMIRQGGGNAWQQSL